MVTTTRDLETMMRFNDDFLGVFSKDNIPIMENKNQCAIINSDTGNLGGTHWIAIKDYGGYVMYFDAAGWIPIRSICSRLKKRIKVYTFHNIQPIISQTCGQHCVYFLNNNMHAPSENILHMYINKLM